MLPPQRCYGRCKVMFGAHKNNAVESHIDVTLDASGIINCVMYGHITEALVKKSMQETAAFVRQLSAQNEKPLLLIDASQVASQTSGARSQAKMLSKMNIEKIAVCGPSPALSLIVQYLIRSGGMAKYAQVFRTQGAAKRWLKRKTPTSHAPQGRGVRIILSAIVGIGALTGILGWAIGSPYLMSLVPGLKPINPISAITLVLCALGLLFIGKHGAGKGLSRVLPFVAGAWAIIFGSTIILRDALSAPIPIDAWLFTEAVQTAAPASLTANRSAYMFLFIGIMFLCVLTGQKQRWQRILFAAASTGAFLVPFGAFINYSFGLEVVFSSPGSIKTALGILLLNYGLQTVARQVSIFQPIWEGFHKYAPAFFVGASLAIVTGIAWQQSDADLETNVNTAIQQEFASTEVAITDRLDGYINTLRGFKSFYNSSDSVTPPEFRTYYRSSDIEKNYPGFTAITFVYSLQSSERQKFNNDIRRTFASSAFPNYKNFSIYPITDRSTMYPTTIVEPSSAATNYGFDLASNDTRRDTLERARDTGDIAASEVIDLNAARNDPTLQKRPGFYLTIPVYKAGTDPQTVTTRQAEVFGFVNALFESSKLFGNIFSEGKTPSTAKYVISNARSGEVLHTHDGGDPAIEPDLKFTKQFFVGGQVWKLDMYTTPYFTVQDARQTPMAVFITGAVFTLLASSLMVMQLRRKDHAVQLAESMTEDLSNERNKAIISQQKDEAVLSSIGDAVFAVDMHGKITLFNPSASQISGFSKDEAIGRHYHDILKFILEKDGSRHDSFITQALSGFMSSMKNHTLLIRKDGSKVPVADSAAPIRDAKGKLLGAIIVFRDVTRENELDRAKSEFVSLASHQLRTPLSAIGWYSEMLLNGDAGKLTKEQKEQVTEIYEGNQRMVELVNSLLNVSRLEVGKLQNDAEPTSLTDILHSLQQELKPSITAKEMKLESHIDEALPKITADPKLLRMIVQNLMSNAVKYTPEKGKVTVTLRSVTAESADLHSLNLKQPLSKYVLLKVTDTGYGIPESQHGKIFQKMFRADNVRALDVEGTGLGLYIVREVVQKLGGKIWFESEEGKGTTFTVVLPFVTKSTVPKP
jgi:PAS domain S-box-containing protein